MKKILALLMASALLVSLAACDKKAENNTDTSTTAATTTPAATTTTTDAEDNTTTADATTTTADTAESTTAATEGAASTAKPTASKKPTEATKPTKTTAPTTTPTAAIIITDEEAYNCVEFVMTGDYNYYENYETYKFAFKYDFVLFERIEAPYEVESITVLSSSVGGGRECQCLQPASPDKIYKVARECDGDGVGLDAVMKNWGCKEVEAVCRIKSPELNIMKHESDVEAIYNDFTITIKIVFKNGVEKILTYTGSQDEGIGGPGGGCSDSDFIG